MYEYNCQKAIPYDSDMGKLTRKLCQEIVSQQVQFHFRPTLLLPVLDMDQLTKFIASAASWAFKTSIYFVNKYIFLFLFVFVFTFDYIPGPELSLHNTARGFHLI